MMKKRNNILSYNYIVCIILAHNTYYCQINATFYTYAMRIQLVRRNRNTTRRPTVTTTYVFGFKLQIWN